MVIKVLIALIMILMFVGVGILVSENVEMSDAELFNEAVELKKILSSIINKSS